MTLGRGPNVCMARMCSASAARTRMQDKNEARLAVDTANPNALQHIILKCVSDSRILRANTGHRRCGRMKDSQIPAFESQSNDGGPPFVGGWYGLSANSAPCGAQFPTPESGGITRIWLH